MFPARFFATSNLPPKPAALSPDSVNVAANFLDSLTASPIPNF